MNKLLDDFLYTIDSSLRSARWVRQASHEAGISLDPTDVDDILEAGETLANGIEALKRLLDSGDAADVIDAISSTVDGFGTLGDRVPAQLVETLGIGSAFDLLLLVTSYTLDDLAPGLGALMRVLGIIEFQHLPANGTRQPTIARRASSRVILDAFERPADYLIERISSRTSPFSRGALLEAVASAGAAPVVSTGSQADWLESIAAARSPITNANDEISEAALVSFNLGAGGYLGAALYVLDAGPEERIRLGIAPLFGGPEPRIELSANWTFEVTGELSLPRVVAEFEADRNARTLQSWFASSDVPPAVDNLGFSLRGYEATPLNLPLEPLADIDIRGLEVTVSIKLGPAGEPETRIGIGLGAVEVTLSAPQEISAFVGSREDTSLQFSLSGELNWSSIDGFSGSFAGGIVFDRPMTIDLGPLSITHVRLAIRTEIGGDSGLRVAGGVDLKLTLGPAVLTLIDPGFDIVLYLNRRNESVSAALRAPRGAGVRIDGGAVKGEGFLSIDAEKGRYAGALELTVAEFSVAAVGLIQTRPSTSVLIVLSAEFPGIQVGFGFTLNGISGLVGIHRRADVDVMRARLTSGSVAKLMAPEDPVDNAAAVISNLEVLFPTERDHHVIGLGVQLRWIELIRFDAGIIIELPGPSRIILLGSARAEVPEGKPLVRIRIDILGVLDFERREITIDGALIDSMLLEVLELTGGGALRASYGAQPYVILTIGGFHPKFIPEPAVLPIPARVGMVSEADFFYLRVAGYFAVTPNTVQFGGAVEIRVSAGPFEAKGELGLDALIQFDPFYFIFEFRARFRISISGFTLAGASISGSLSGPGPLVFRGKVCIELLFIDICWSGTIRIGSSVEQSVPTIGSVLDQLLPEINADNLTITAMNSSTLVKAERDEIKRRVVDPSSIVQWSQSRAPLGLLLERFEGTALAEPLEVRVVGMTEENAAREWFAPKSFANYTDAEAVNLKAFELLAGGMQIALNEEAKSPEVSRPLKVDQFIRPNPSKRQISQLALPVWLTAPAIAAAGIPAISLARETWSVLRPDGSVISVSSAESVAQHQARVAGAVAIADGDQVEVGNF